MKEKNYNRLVGVFDLIWLKLGVRGGNGMIDLVSRQ
jgi:hypothetical protein